MNADAKLGCSMRMVFAGMSAFIWIGIALTGFGNVHWFIYIPAIATAVVAITGICMGNSVAGRFCRK
ncbi:MAG: hypothetical protein V3U78_03555 [Thiotrichaceae bacterium]